MIRKKLLQIIRCSSYLLNLNLMSNKQQLINQVISCLSFFHSPNNAEFIDYCWFGNCYHAQAKSNMCQGLKQIDLSKLIKN
jgi:hypothetical protein